MKNGKKIEDPMKFLKKADIDDLSFDDLEENPAETSASEVIATAETPKPIVQEVKLDVIARCSVCPAEFSHEDLAAAQRIGYCPHCKTTVAPQWIAHDVSLTINWFELRMLCSAASEKLSAAPELVPLLQRVLDKIRSVRPRGSLPLTVEEEFLERSLGRPPSASASGGPKG